MKYDNFVWRLTRRNISVGQIAGYAIANLVGLTIVLTAFQFWRDTRAGSADGDSEPFFKSDYMVVSRQVSELGSLMGAKSGFSDEDIAGLLAQPWAEKVGRFTPARFNVAGTVSLGGRSISSQMFLESIPDEFFDIQPEGWHIDPEDYSAEVPVVVSKDYLALYNFGFATSSGMPRISENLVEKVPLHISLSGNGRQTVRRARIVGFSSRINTIAVPENFMKWANAAFQNPMAAGGNEVSRLIIKVSDPGNPAIERYMEENGIEVSGGKLQSGRTAYFLSIVSMVVIVIGAVISALAFFILMLSIFLLLQKNRDKLHRLMQLGYTPTQVASHYYLLVAIVNASILILACVAMLLLSSMWKAPFRDLGLASVSPAVTIFTGIALMAIVTAINFMAIKRIVKKNF